MSIGFGLGITLVASLGWSVLDASRKSLVRRIDLVPLLTLLALGQLPLFVAWGAWEGRWFSDPRAYLLPGLASVLLNVAANLLYLRAVKLSPLSLVIPLLSFVPVFTVLAANPLLGELPRPLQLLGIGLVVIGALVLNAGSEKAKGPIGLFRALLHERGSVPMLGTALCWALTIVVDKLATAHASYPAHGVIINAGIGLVMSGWLLVRKDLKKLGQARGSIVLLIGAVAAASTGLGAQLVAIQYLFTGVVEAIKRGIGITLSVIFGRMFFAEPVTTPKIVAVLLMSAGTVTIVVL